MFFEFSMIFCPNCLYPSVVVAHNLVLICGPICGRDGKAGWRGRSETANPGSMATVAGLNLPSRALRAKKWVLRFLWQGKAREMGLGSYPEVGPAEAREKAMAVRSVERSGIDSDR